MGSHVEAWARGYGEGREACAATVDPEREPRRIAGSRGWHGWPMGEEPAGPGWIVGGFSGLVAA
jgi:hypothetical protein